MNTALPNPRQGKGPLLLFFLLACGTTWALDLPLALATARGVQPSQTALSLGGLGAFGPTFAALVVAAYCRDLRAVFGRWRTRPVWILAGLLLLPALHLPATLIEVALGGNPAHWFYPPVEPERLAALVMFPIGEEFGWRGFAYPRLERRYGPVLGCLLLGVWWSLWHFAMWVTPKGPPTLLTLGSGAVELAAASLVFAWVFEKSNRSLAVAIALHAGAHLDNVYRAPESEVRLRVLRLIVIALAAAFAARSLLARRRASEAESSPSG